LSAALAEAAAEPMATAMTAADKSSFFIIVVLR
jgi:hypothetical protein